MTKSLSNTTALRGGLFFLLLLASLCFAQEQQQPLASKPISARARLDSAKTIYVKHGGGSDVPYKVASSIVENWGRFQMARSAEEADIVLEVTGPSDSSGMSISSTTQDSSGRPHSSTKTTRDIPNSGPVKFLVYDPKSRLPLWSGTEQPKSGFKQKAREDNLVEAAEKLAAKFHERLEPNLAK